jgi:hypothetical protein
MTVARPWCMRWCLTVLGVVAGCGGPGGVGDLVPVSGRVTVNGQPLTRGTVSFRPDPARGNDSLQEPYGKIDAQGNYRLCTAGKPGAPRGWYKVLVVSAEAIDPRDPYAPRRSFIDPKYGQMETSDLAVEVVEKPAAGAYDLALMLTSPDSPRLGR